MSDAFISVDFDWKILYLNSKTAIGSALPRDRIVGCNLWEAYPILVDLPLYDFYQRCMQSRQAGEMEHYSEVSGRWHHVRALPGGSGLNVYISDISDNKKIAEGQEQFLTMANSIPQLAWMADREGNIHWYNDRWYEYTGTSLEEMAGWGWQKVHHPEHVDRVVAYATEAWQQDQPWELTFPLRGQDGRYRWYLTRVYPIKDSLGKVEQWIGTNTDIQDQKLANDTLERKVAERTGELEAANEHLRRVNGELQQFNYVASHDLQEPLRKIKLFTERIKIQDYANLSADSGQFLDRAMVAVDRMSNLLKDLLDFSSMNREELFKQVDLNDILADIGRDLELLVAQKLATIHVADLPMVKAIPLQMHQLFYNLVNNAIKFTPPERRPVVRIDCRVASPEEAKARYLDSAHDYLYLTVEDNGVGFEAEYAEKIFELFKRLHSQQSYSGTGVGLALCKKVVENHEGRIWAESVLGEGATFHIILPV